MINNSVSTLLEIKGLDPDLVSIINEYLSLLFSFEEFKIISPQKKLILKSNLFFQKEPIDLKFSMSAATPADAWSIDNVVIERIV